MARSTSHHRSHPLSVMGRNSVLATIVILGLVRRGFVDFGDVHDYARALQSEIFSTIATSTSSINETTTIVSVSHSNDGNSSPKALSGPQLNNRLTYYVPARGARDRSGAAVMDMLKAQAYSFSKGVRFGGACGNSPHRTKNEEMIRVLGLETLLKYQCPPANDTDGEEHVMITRNHFFDKAYTYFTDEWMNYIHTKILPQSQMRQEEEHQQTSSYNSSDNSSSSYTIVMHIRRGDIDPCGRWSFRYLPNSHYLSLLNFYKQRVPANRIPQCIVFSESHSLVENFDDFRKQGCEVILDGDPTMAWKAMSHANVLVLSASSFSMVPALLNRNGTIAYTPHGNRILRPDWDWHEYKHHNQNWRQLIQLCDNPPKK